MIFAYTSLENHLKSITYLTIAERCRYVHRLIQNKADGKLVELPAEHTEISTLDNMDTIPIAMYSEQKLDEIGLEFSHLLTTSLESQRLYYEDQTNEICTKFESQSRHLSLIEDELSKIRSEYVVMRSHYQDQKTIVDQLQHELKMKSNEVSVYKSKTVGYEQQIRSLRCELDEERAIAESLRANQALWTQQAQKWEEERQIWKRERNDLEEQVRDLMIFLDARNKIETMATEEERNEATVHVGPSSTSKTRGKRRHGKK